MELVTVATTAGDRRYLLFRPPTPGRQRYPILMFLHGTGGTAVWADGETGLSKFAADHGFALVLPEGLPPDPTRPPKFLTNPPRWTDGSTHPGDPPYTNPDDVEFLTAVIADMIHRGPADPHRVYVTGFSNGAGMAFRFAAERADLVAAVAPVAGHCWDTAPRPARPVPTLYVVGTDDPLIPLRGGLVRSPWGGRLVRRPPVAETVQRWVAAVGCDPAGRTVSEANGVREETFAGSAECRVIFVEGLGHHWPGGQCQLSPRIGGRPSDRLDANARIWEFVRQHHL